MGKIYNVQLNSSLATAVSTTSLPGYSKMQYNIDWANLLPDKKFKLTFAMMSAISFGLNISFPYITTNLLGHSYQPATNGFQNAYYLGHLRQNTTLSSVVASSTYVYSTFTADVNENTPIYLEKRPANNNLIVSILNSISNTEFTDTYATVQPGGTMKQDGFIITVQTFTAGVLTIGSVITPTSQPARTITGFITGFGNVGLYLCNFSQTVATGTGFTANADTTPSGFPPYILNLSFEELD
jgi:hypothetical protein